MGTVNGTLRSRRSALYGEKFCTNTSSQRAASLQGRMQIKTDSDTLADRATGKKSDNSVKRVTGMERENIAHKNK